MLFIGMRNREERVVGGELQPAIGTGGPGQERGGVGLSFFEEEEEVEVLVDKGEGRSLE